MKDVITFLSYLTVIILGLVVIGLVGWLAVIIIVATYAWLFPIVGWWAIPIIIGGSAFLALLINGIILIEKESNK